MRRWIALAAAFYPAEWRRRYGDEFAALLEDHNPGWSEFIDVVRGAFKMQITNTLAYWKLAGGVAVAGAIAATAISFGIPRVYVSTAVLRVAPPPNAQFADPIPRLNQMEQEILSRTSLERIVTQSGLYKEERLREPMEDIVQRMRTREILIRPITGAPATAGPAFAVSFSYRDQEKAQAVVRSLITEFTEENVQVTRTQAKQWQTIWPQAPVPPGPTLEVLDPASLPRNATFPGHLQFAAAGLVLGLLLGLLTAVVMRWPKPALHIAGFAVGFCILATAISLVLPETYTSSAVLRIVPPRIPASLTAQTPAAPDAGKFQRLEQVALSRTALEGMINDPALGLDKERQSHEPREETVIAMRRAIHIRPVGPTHSALWISFSYSDPEKAQAVVRKLITKFTEENVADEVAQARESDNPKVREIAEHKLSASLEVLDPPSFPEEPISPNRGAISFAGFALGGLLGSVTLYRGRRRAPAPQSA